MKDSVSNLPLHKKLMAKIRMNQETQNRMWLFSALKAFLLVTMLYFIMWNIPRNDFVGTLVKQMLSPGRHCSLPRPQNRQFRSLVSGTTTMSSWWRHQVFIAECFKFTGYYLQEILVELRNSKPSILVTVYYN